MATTDQFLASLDQASIDKAAQFAAMHGRDELAAYFADRDGTPDSPAATNPLAAYFGHSQALLSDLLGIISRDRAELIHLRSLVGELADDLAAEKAARGRA